jgi:hypothetical protein
VELSTELHTYDVIINFEGPDAEEEPVALYRNRKMKVSVAVRVDAASNETAVSVATAKILDSIKGSSEWTVERASAFIVKSDH